MEEIKGSKDVALVKEGKTNEITKAITQDELNRLDYTDFNTPAKMLALGKVLVNSKMCPLKKPEDVVVVLMRGNTLGLPPVVSITEIYPVNGKATLGVHIVRGILLQKGVWFERTNNFEAIYEFAFPPKKEGEAPTIIGTGFLDEQPEGSVKRKIDTGTKYKFEREIVTPNGNVKTIRFESIFSVKDAQSAGLMDKDNWKNYLKNMLDARAFIFGARNIAGDYLNGIYLPSEIIDSTETQETYIIDEEGSEAIIIED